MRIVILIFVLVSFLPSALMGQQDKNCVEEVISIEKKQTINEDSLGDRTVMLNYSVKVINWEDETVLSNVKVYRNKENVHLFSEQAVMMNDSREVLLILPVQQVIVRNTYDKQLNKLKQLSQFETIRKSFLDSCEIQKCETGANGITTLVLRVKPVSQDGELKIRKITYVYNTADSKIISVRTEYASDYQMKEMLITYHEFKDVEYKFNPLKSYLYDRKGNLLPKYKEYELVDNREEIVSRTNTVRPGK